MHHIHTAIILRSNAVQLALPNLSNLFTVEGKFYQIFQIFFRSGWRSVAARAQYPPNCVYIFFFSSSITRLFALPGRLVNKFEFGFVSHVKRNIQRNNVIPMHALYAKLPLFSLAFVSARYLLVAIGNRSLVAAFIPTSVQQTCEQQ